jgi:membrane associated rhomboid family serine protease
MNYYHLQQNMMWLYVSLQNLEKDGSSMLLLLFIY